MTDEKEVCRRIARHAPTREQRRSDNVVVCGGPVAEPFRLWIDQLMAL